MDRRDFVKYTSILAIAGAGTVKSEIAKVALDDTQKIKPPKLKEGDTVGLVAPGSFIDKRELEESIKNLNSIGLKAVYTDNIMKYNGYLAGSDYHRAEDIITMFSADEVKGIFCVRGGYGAQRILNDIDYDLVKKNPKTLIGYSDVTALLYALYAKARLVTFHGPVAISTFDDYSVEYMRKVLFDDTRNTELKSNPEHDNLSYVFRGGKVEGELIGGNLSIMVSMLGTPYDVDYKDKIVFIEDVGEEPYRIDRMLTQLMNAGHFDNIKGIALGVFKNCDIRRSGGTFSKSFSLQEVLFDRLFHLNIPVAYGLSFGHISNKFTIPFGINAIFDANEKKITLLENSVI